MPSRQLIYLSGLWLLFSLVASEQPSLAQGRLPSSVSAAIDMQPLEPGEYLYVVHKRILFATNRNIVQPAASNKRGASLVIDEIFSASRSPLLAYGWLEVGYPSDRQLAEQNYYSAYSFSPGPNSFKYFSIERFGFVSSRVAAGNLARDPRFDARARSLAYVHGINESFRDGAERLTQLVADLDVKGVPLLFSWPADQTPVTPFTLNRTAAEAYRTTLGTAKKSELSLRQSIDDFLSDRGDHFDVVAHSMGTLVAFDVLTERVPISPTNQDPLSPIDVAPNIVLAAPDIGMKDFASAREALVNKARRLTIYCGQDRALVLSKLVNRDDRLGYCGEPKQQKDYMEGVEFIRVWGSYRDLFNHSYYINTPQIITDMRRALFGKQPDEIARLPYREIFLNQ